MTMENSTNEPSAETAESSPHKPTLTTVPPKNQTWPVLCHLLSLCQFLVPFGNIFGPLILWLLKRNEDELVDACGKESLNFQISMTIYMVIAGILVLAVVGLFILPVLMILNIVYTVIAAIKASEGTSYRYPMSIRFIK